MEQYLHASSHHFLAQKIGVLNTLATRAPRISDENHLEEEKSHLLKVFDNNGYSRQQGLKAFQRDSKESKVKPTRDDQIPNVQLPSIQGTTDNISHILKKNRFYVVFNPLNTMRNSLRYVKIPINPRDMKGVYSIPCSCGIHYIGETGCSINQRIHEHAVDIRHSRSRSFALAEHAVKS